MPNGFQPSTLSADALEERAMALKVLRFRGKLDLIRRARGLTIGQLAAKSEVPEKTLERICEGRGAPCAAHFVRLIKALDIDISAIEPEDLEESGMP